VRVDIFYQHLGARRQAIVDLAGSVLFLLPVVAFIAWSSWSYVAASWAIHETSTDGGLPLVYLQKSLLLAFPLVLGLQGVAEILRALLVLRGEHPETFAEDRGEL
jgi:TRAP-type mannitol/chloroaromatic compound transport system permease small subunit